MDGSERELHDLLVRAAGDGAPSPVPVGAVLARGRRRVRRRRWAAVASSTLVAALVLGVRAWAVRGPLWGCLVIVPVLQALATGTMMSMSRIGLAAFPAAIDAAELIRPRATFAVVAALMLAAELVIAGRYVNWINTY